MSAQASVLRTELTLKVVGASHELRNIWIRARLIRPDGPVKALMVCLPGASYDRRYYDHCADQQSGYSFAAHMAKSGIACLALDHPGMGESSRPDNVGILTKETVASLHHSAFQAFLVDAVNGKWGPTIGFCPRIGVGHSMGGMVLTQWQAAYTRFDSCAFLGWTNTGLSFDTSFLPRPDKPAYLPTDRAMMRPIFHLGDVPAALIDEDDAQASDTPSPLALQAIEAGIVRDQAGQIKTPVLTVFGDVDISPDPFTEPAHFKSSRDVTLLRLEGAAHIHNFAGSRAVLWDRLANWALATRNTLTSHNPQSKVQSCT